MLAQWLQGALDYLGLSEAEASLIVALLALLVSLGVVVRPVRRLAGRAYRRILLVGGWPRWRYSRWFLREYKTLRNIYLDQTEELGLASTYVPLSFSADRTRESRVPATRVLTEPDAERTLIVGDPGAGKSTLLKAYGVGLLRHRRAAPRDLRLSGRSSREVPFLVSLRHFAQQLDDRPEALARYLANRILEHQARLHGWGDGLLRRLLRQDRCVVLLDGLDEVSESRYLPVRDAVLEFLDGAGPGPPTSQARVVLTCRRQNFLRLRGDWIPVFTEQEHVLAPFNDSEIFRFAEKRMRLSARRTASAFMASVESSGTQDLHRVPLVLAISLSLYLSRDHYEIPQSISVFYDEMIKEMLSRHDFRLQKVGKANRFAAGDKYRFLRRFALTAAGRSDSFADFTFAEIVEQMKLEAPRMARTSAEDAEPFVHEIIDHSGLIVRTSATDADEDNYAFAHRSVQEYLVAVQLQRQLPAGADELLARVGDPEWRQVVIFFSALDHEHVDPFLSGVADRNLELAGHCLAGALPSDGVAEVIVDRLRGAVQESADVPTALAALVYATRAPRIAVAEDAAARLREVLSDPSVFESLRGVLSGDPEGSLRLISALAQARNLVAAEQVPSFAAAVPPEETRLVGPLWRCLEVPAIVDHPDIAGPTVELLLRGVTDPRCTEELEHQPPYEPDFADPLLRRAAYPFDQGRDPRSNLVTLLCWAERLGVPAVPPNRFFEAKAAGVLGRLERDRRLAKSFQPYRVSRVLSLLAFLAAVGIAAYLLIDDWHLLTRPWGWWTLALLSAPGVAAFLLVGVLAELSLRRRLDERPGRRMTWFSLAYASYLVDILDVLATGVDFHEGRYFWNWDTVYLAVLASVTTLPYGIALSPLADRSPAWYAPITTLVIWVLFYVPVTDLVRKDRRYYLRRPNEFVDVYDDPHSRHWVLLP